VYILCVNNWLTLLDSTFSNRFIAPLPFLIPWPFAGRHGENFPFLHMCNAVCSCCLGNLWSCYVSELAHYTMSSVKNYINLSSLFTFHFLRLSYAKIKYIS
jgi:hypothetical protein